MMRSRPRCAPRTTSRHGRADDEAVPDLLRGAATVDGALARCDRDRRHRAGPGARRAQFAQRRTSPTEAGDDEALRDGAGGPRRSGRPPEQTSQRPTDGRGRPGFRFKSGGSCDGHQLRGGRHRRAEPLRHLPMDSARVAAYSAGRHRRPPGPRTRRGGRPDAPHMRDGSAGSRSGGALVGSVLAGAGALPAAAGVPVGTYFEGAARQPVVGLPGMTLSMYASEGGSPPGTSAWSCARRTLRRARGPRTNGPSPEISAAPSSWAAAPSMTPATWAGISAHDLMRFSAAKAATNHDLVCFGSDVVYATQLRRTGVLTATLRLSTKSIKLGTFPASRRGPPRQGNETITIVARPTPVPRAPRPPPATPPRG